jgi:5-methylcytosine-specific restriction endonuclease McrA
MSIAAVVDALVAAGATPEMIAAAVRAHCEQEDFAKAEKRARDAERQRKSRMSRNVTAALPKARSSAAIRQERYRDGRLPAREWEPLRLKIFARDGFCCTYCGGIEGPFECDHVVPTSRGGSNDESNLTTACKPCNASKRDRLVEEWMA